MPCSYPVISSLCTAVPIGAIVLPRARGDEEGLQGKFYARGLTGDGRAGNGGVAAHASAAGGMIRFSLPHGV